MSKVAVVYWSGTGNTEEMANAVADGAKSAGCEVCLAPVAEFSAERMDEFDAVAFGCPAMGAEELEDSEFDLIKFPQRGVCLYKCGNERYLLEVHAPPYKEALFGKAGGR